MEKPLLSLFHLQNQEENVSKTPVPKMQLNDQSAAGKFGAEY